MPLDLSNPPKHQLEMSLRWLKNLAFEVEKEIRAIEQHLADDKASRRKRDLFNSLVRGLVSENLTDKQAEKKLVEMAYPPESIEGAKNCLKALSARRRREMRDAEIVRRVLVNKESRTALAKEYKISRKQVYVIIAQANPLRR